MTLALILATACTNGKERPSGKESAPETEQAEIVVTRDLPSLPRPWRPRQVAGIVLDFFAAFNHGDESRLARFFPRKTFLWYSVEGGPGERAVSPSPYDPTTLLSYFQERHLVGERLRLLTLAVVDARVTDEVEGRIEPVPAAGARFLVGRRADDFAQRDATRYGGEAFLNRRDRTILYWSMRTAPRPPERLCPEPPAATTRSPVIACAVTRRES